MLKRSKSVLTKIDVFQYYLLLFQLDFWLPIYLKLFFAFV